MEHSLPLLDVRRLGVQFKTINGVFEAVRDVSFSLEKGKTLALVGESGSGKSVTALSILQLLPYPLAAHTAESSIRFEGQELVGKDEAFMRGLRGSKIGMIFQEPMTALNPLHTIERQIAEPLRLHKGMDAQAARARVVEMLDMVQLPLLKERLGAYPHELSGGQRQRVMIAMALANTPSLLIADEPTTALDVTVQAEILDLLATLKKDLGMAMLMITHDLSIVERFADTVCVMKNGHIVETNKTAALFDSPQHPYSKMLLGSRPSGDPPVPNPKAPAVIETQSLRVHFPKTKSFWGKPKAWIKAVDGVDILLREGHTLGVVGESGSGKSTLGYALLRLVRSEGKIVFFGKDIAALQRKEMIPLRADMQIVFQDPFSALSPRMSVAEIISEGLDVHSPHRTKQEREEKVIAALEQVHLDPETRHRYPHEFSGGQRQRIAIARAIILEPKFVILDEPTSALDVSVQAQIVDLLREIQTRKNLTYIFISHDLRVVRAMAHDLLVMKDGRVVESGSAATVFNHPQNDYTKTLLDAALNLKVKRLLA